MNKDMTFTVTREIFTKDSTIGILTGPGIEEPFYTLEDVARAAGVKIYHHTAISHGRYMMKLTYSNRFKRDLPLIYNESDFSCNDHFGARFTGVRIHRGNTSEDTSGCILVGTKMSGDWIYNSREAEEKFISLLKPGEIYYINIINKQKLWT